MTKRLRQAMCDHSDGKAVVRHMNLSTPTVTTTASFSEVICSVCGKVLVPARLYEDVKAAIEEQG